MVRKPCKNQEELLSSGSPTFIAKYLGKDQWEEDVQFCVIHRISNQNTVKQAPFHYTTLIVLVRV